MKKKSMASLMLAAVMAVGSGMTAFAATAQDIINLNPAGYTAGTSSVYGPSLTQDQLNQVAQVVADFKTNYILDSMDNDTKIKTAYDYLVNHVSYIDWDQGEGANAAFGALVRGQAACSGYARAFKALCDAMGVSCYYIHSTGNDHQWNMVEFNDGYYFVDVEANDSSGFDWIYHSTEHPYPYDAEQFPAIGSKSGQNPISPTGAPADEGWEQDSNGWWWRNADGTYPVNQWKEINGNYYYFGTDGYMLANTTTPDGYQVDASGAWDGKEPASDNSQLVYSIWEATKSIDLNGTKCEEKTSPDGSIYYLISDDTTAFTIGDTTNLDPQRVNVSFSTISYNPDTMEIYPFSQDGTSISNPFDYNSTYELQIPQNPSLRGQELADSCKQRSLMVAVAFERPDEFEVSMFYFVFE